MTDIYLYIYDLSNGLAAQLSVQLTGRFFKAIYHTSIVIFGREYFFGGSGVESSLPAQSHHGTPIEKRLMGQTEIDSTLWHQFLEDCAEEYGVGKYHLLEHNCNTFSDAALQFLLGEHIPAEISSLPSDFLSTPLGMMLRTQIDAMYAPRPGAIKTEVPINGPTSGNHVDRTGESFRFDAAPTLSKIFLKVRAQHPNDALARLEAHTKNLINGLAPTSQGYQDDIVAITNYLLSYFSAVAVSDNFAGLDIARIWLKEGQFATYQINHPELLATIFKQSYDDELSPNSLGVLLKLICNALTNITLRPSLLSILRQYEKLEVISSTPLSSNPTIQESGLKTIWNLMILADGIDTDFQVACLASCAESRGSSSTELESIKTRILKEIMQGASDEIIEMAEILDLEI